MNTFFTLEEENIICAFDVSSRTALINSIHAAIPAFDGEEPELQEIAGSAIRKLEAMTDAEFSEYVFSPAYYDDESEV